MFFNKIANFKKAAMFGFAIAAFSTNGNAMDKQIIPFMIPNEQQNDVNKQICDIVPQKSNNKITDYNEILKILRSIDDDNKKHFKCTNDTLYNMQKQINNMQEQINDIQKQVNNIETKNNKLLSGGKYTYQKITNIEENIKKSNDKLDNMQEQINNIRTQANNIEIKNDKVLKGGTYVYKKITNMGESMKILNDNNTQITDIILDYMDRRLDNIEKQIDNINQKNNNQILNSDVFQNNIINNNSHINNLNQIHCNNNQK